VKRPEGFDPKARQPQAPATPARRAPSPRAKPAATPPAVETPGAQQPGAQRPPRSNPVPAPSAARTHRDAQRALRKASRERKRFERGEIKRFTRRSRSRRATVFTAVGVVAALGAVLAVAVFSPLLSLRTIEVRGTTRIESADVLAAVNGQLGTPLALLDLGRLERDLGDFSLIRSYVTQTVPPDTLVITITEREPVGVLQRGESFDLVDPAGIVVQTTTERPENVPLIVIESNKTDGAAFESLIEVLLALPSGLLAQVDTITATTKDDVGFTLRGGKQSVVWGSVEQSAYKARVLNVVIQNYAPTKRVEFDVSAPDSVVVNTG